MKIELINMKWKTVYAIPKGVTLTKGRRGQHSKSIRSNCQSITCQFGCYAWKVGALIHYCGSFTKDYTNPKVVSNLEGRILNYLENHYVSKGGNPNTNLHVFNSINALLSSNSVELAILEFESLKLDNKKVLYTDYCTDSYLVKAIERLLICINKRQNQCPWNRS